ncbi:hypothetical protein LXA43DRAFT_1099039 [Ganoderma leucocontextum]|nr:hypothetical protein LXA43DRAFT_1099039 [Ganoderma leucocontextum]
MSAVQVSAQEMAYLYPYIYCNYAACAILVYDWFLCLDQEVRFIWNWRSKLTGPSLVYALSRYAVLTQSLLIVASNYPMSDLAVTGILSAIAIGAFSALRAYALSNKKVWLAAIIILLALPPTATSIFMAELLVVAVTWWYSYRSYRIQRSVQLGRTISSFLVYNGSIYFLFLATLYILDIIFHSASVPDNVLNADSFLELFFDPITSILTCRFILSLRQFDSNIASATCSGRGSRGCEHAASTVLEFAAQPSESLPAFIASFAHPVHVDSAGHSEALSEVDCESDAVVDDGPEGREMDVVTAPARDTRSRSCQTPVP